MVNDLNVNNRILTLSLGEGFSSISLESSKLNNLTISDSARLRGAINVEYDFELLLDGTKVVEVVDGRVGDSTFRTSFALVQVMSDFSLTGTLLGTNTSEVENKFEDFTGNISKSVVYLATESFKLFKDSVNGLVRILLVRGYQDLDLSDKEALTELVQKGASEGTSPLFVCVID